MSALRRNLRAVATTWVILQVAWLTALVPRDCCLSHRPAKTAGHASHGARSEHAGHQTAMHHHQPAAVEHHHDTSTPSNECRMAGRCDGPMAALFALLANQGVLPDVSSAVPDTDVRTTVAALQANPIGRVESPDAPPPRT
jgi:hypothetical protein